jgi:hypothetical protein
MYGHSEKLTGPRLGASLYPAGNLEGLALYAGLGEIAEIGLWGVWRGGSGSRHALTFRLGIGAIAAGTSEGMVGGGPAIGAALGSTF